MTPGFAADSPLTLTPPARALATTLHRQLRGRWADLDDPSSAETLDLPDYRAAPVPGDLRGRRAELIVEASDLAALSEALTSDADALVMDFDDTFAPTRENVQAAYDALPLAAASGRPLLARPRALYAVEKSLDMDGPAIAALCDVAVILSARPERPMHLYIPKLESVAEAQFWDDALVLAEAELGLAPNAIRVCLQIETFLGVRHADALLYALRGRAFGLNAGRWDYVFSLIKTLGASQGAAPPRSELTMDVDAMRAYAEALVRVAQRRGAEAIGGSAALAPDPLHPHLASELVRADKRREAAQGFTAAWAGLPPLLGAVRAGFAAAAPAPLPPETPERTLERLLGLPAARPLALATLQDTLGLALDVFAAWYAGRGVVVRGGRIEDTATAELARAQLWQWLQCQAELEGGEHFTTERYFAERRAQRPDAALEARLLDALVLSAECPAYFPSFAQTLESPLARLQGVCPMTHPRMPHASGPPLARTVLDACAALAAFTTTPGYITRTYLSEPTRQAHDFLSAWAARLGMPSRIDAAGNLRSRRESPLPGAATLYIGSHLDTVPNAGAYDGVLGVVLGYAMLEALGPEPLPFSVEVVGFSEEEGVRYGVPFIGSRALLGRASELLDLRDESGLTVRDAISAYGLSPAELPDAEVRGESLGLPGNPHRAGPGAGVFRPGSGRRRGHCRAKPPGPELRGPRLARRHHPDEPAPRRAGRRRPLRGGCRGPGPRHARSGRHRGHAGSAARRDQRGAGRSQLHPGHPPRPRRGAPRGAAGTAGRR